MAPYISGQIEVKVMCVIRSEDRILVSKGYDKVKGEPFYRFLGGSVEFGETTESAMKREAMEELTTELTNLRLIDTVDSIFMYNNEQRHQVVFLYEADLSDVSLYNQESIHIIDASIEFDAVWISISDVVRGKKILYPAHDYSKILK